jgi:hypothetical protein
MHGLTGLRSFDMIQGNFSNVFGPERTGASMVACIGAYVLSHGKIELVQRLATEC